MAASSSPFSPSAALVPPIQNASKMAFPPSFSSSFSSFSSSSSSSSCSPHTSLTVRYGCLLSGGLVAPKLRLYQALSDVASTLQPTIQEVVVTDDVVIPTPIVVINQESDPDATVVDLSFGDRLGALLDTMQALKLLGLNVVKSTLSVDGAIGRKRFSITQGESRRKVEDPEMLEAIRLTIINNMLEYHPESSALLAMGSVFGVTLPSQLDVDIATQVQITQEEPHRSLLYIRTADRPGLLREIVKFLTETNVSYESGGFDTEGLVAKLKFYIKYRGEAITKSRKQAIINSFHYFLRRPDTNEDSY